MPRLRLAPCRVRLQALFQRHIHLQALGQLPGIFHCLARALAGVGFALLARTACAAHLAQGDLVHVELDLQAVPLDVVACYPSHRHLAAKTRALLVLLQQTLAQA